MDLIKQFRAARQVGTPIVKIDTPDAAATIDRLRSNAIAASTPIVLHDVVQGWRPGNEAGLDAIREVMRALAAEAGGGAPPEPRDVTANPIDCMVNAPRLPEKTVLFAINAHRFCADMSTNAVQYVQAVSNLRDLFKGDLRTLVLLGPSVALPPELSGDVLPLDEALPNESELRQIVLDVVESAEIERDDSVVESAVDALRGLAAFSAEQATAMAIEDGKLDVVAVWERKKQMIAATPGLSVWDGNESLEDIGGCEQVKAYIDSLMKGKMPPRVVVFIDEIDKGLAGAGAGGSPGDSSGTAQGQHGQLLTFTQDMEVEGVMELGPPGTAKSAVAKGIGKTYGIPTIVLDLGAMKSSFVGESDARLRTALKVIAAIAGGKGRILFVATCNRIAGISPELRRRFARVFYFDLPTTPERESIWTIWQGKYELKKQTRPSDAGWTGAEIREACKMAWRFDSDLLSTAQYIVPVSKSAEAEINDLRKQADGRFLSASSAGVYRMSESRPFEVAVTAKRRMGKAGDN